MSEQYKIIVSTVPDDFNEQLNDALSDGWCMHSDIHVIPFDHHLGVSMYVLLDKKVGVSNE